MKKKRMIAVMLTAAMAATMFTGCKTKAPESESTESKTDSGKKVLTFNTNSWAAPQNVQVCRSYLTSGKKRIMQSLKSR